MNPRFPVMGLVEVPINLILVAQGPEYSMPMIGSEGTHSTRGSTRFDGEYLAPALSLISRQFNSSAVWPKDAEQVISRISGTRTFFAKPTFIDSVVSKSTLRKVDQFVTAQKSRSLEWSEVEQSFGRLQIGVAADGAPFLVNGALAYAIAIGAGIDCVPAEVVFRHPAWEDFRQQLFSFARLSLDENQRVARDLSHYGGKLYQQAYHFDTRDVPYVYGPSRFGCILKNVDSSSKTVLDIGANFGLMSSEFEQAGFCCTAVEVKEDDYYFLEKLKNYTGGKFESARCSIFDFRNSEILAYDVVLALFIFHHFTKTEVLFDKLIYLLKRISCRELYLGLPDSGELQMQSAYKNLSVDEFARLVVEHTNLENFARVECSGLGNRAILKLW